MKHDIRVSKEQKLYNNSILEVVLHMEFDYCYFAHV